MNNLKARREALRMSQAELSMIADVGFQTISKAERGVKVRASNVRKIEDALTRAERDGAPVAAEPDIATLVDLVVDLRAQISEMRREMQQQSGGRARPKG